MADQELALLYQLLHRSCKKQRKSSVSWLLGTAVKMGFSITSKKATAYTGTLCPNPKHKSTEKEAAELTTEKGNLYQSYRQLKEGVRQIGIVHQSVEHILDNAEKMEQPQQQRRHDIER